MTQPNYKKALKLISDLKLKNAELKNFDRLPYLIDFEDIIEALATPNEELKGTPFESKSFYDVNLRLGELESKIGGAKNKQMEKFEERIKRLEANVFKMTLDNSKHDCLATPVIDYVSDNKIGEKITVEKLKNEL